MSRLFIFMCLCFFIPYEMKADPGGATLTGKVTNKKDNSPLISAVVYFPDLKTGAATDLNGNYKITNLPQGNFLVQVSLLGFATITCGPWRW